jgi:hypothetical protein
MASASEQQGSKVKRDADEAAQREIRNLAPEDAKQLYDQVCANIRATDEISFKLLSLVPLVSGGGITLLLSTNTSLARLPLVIFVGLFGAIVTFGLFRWELRNIQTCSRLIRLGASLERERFELPSTGQFSGRKNEPAPSLYAGRLRVPAFLRQEIGKREAEKIIYPAAIVAWLLLPVVSALLATLDE